mgnify:CR=1 FL=1
MDLGKTLQYSGYVLMAVSVLIAVVSGNFMLMLTTILMAVCMLASSYFLFRGIPTEIPEGEIPDPAVIKQYRIDHPGASLQDALITLMTKPSDKA